MKWYAIAKFSNLSEKYANGSKSSKAWIFSELKHVFEKYFVNYNGVESFLEFHK